MENLLMVMRNLLKTQNLKSYVLCLMSYKLIMKKILFIDRDGTMILEPLPSMESKDTLTLSCASATALKLSAARRATTASASSATKGSRVWSISASIVMSSVCVADDGKSPLVRCYSAQRNLSPVNRNNRNKQNKCD